MSKKKRKISDKQREAVCDLVREVQTTMRTWNWYVKVMRKEADKDCFAQVRVHSEQPYAYLRVSRDFFKQSKEDQVETIVHEMVHVMLKPLDRVVDRVHKDHKGKYHCGNLAAEWYSLETEMLVESLAILIAPTVTPLKHAIR